MGTAPAIRTVGLVKDYGRTRALHGLDLEVRPGEVFGFLGPNGAGKSTTIRLLLDLLRPTAGTVEVLGQDPVVGGPALRARVGYLPGELALPPRTTAGEYLRYLAALRGGRGAGRITALADRFALDLSRDMRALSRGNKQKVGLVQAFMHTPELLVLDEPTSGLDPLLQHEFRRLAREAADDGATVFLSSHVLQEVEQVAGRVAIIRAGVVVDVDDVATLRHRAGQRVVLRFAEPVDAAELDGVPGITDVVVDGATVTCLLRGEPTPLLQVAARHRVLRWQAEDRELEDLFMDFYRTGPVAEAAVLDRRGGTAGAR
ncbi:ABC transporter [Actinotalea ferrariae CF5-4]|uniref:ABC transporter n=1 Tax=Actinotalea ferrariae CF5-4 TaxID=948458 RepID=A0A021VZQ9_9CELL|nr:ABC transporter [Actinotalea ferrariae CF5-4]